MLPEFLIIGAQKSATSYIQNALSHNTEIFIPAGEILFFEDPFYRNNDLSSLEKFYDNATSGVRRGLKRPDYLAMPECPGRISRHIPEAKFIVILRNPITRAVSAYYHYMRSGHLPCLELNAGMKNIIEGVFTKNYPRSSEVLEFGLYAKQIKRYFSYFPKKNFYIATHEEFLKSKREHIEEICEFLGVKSDSRIPHLERNRNKGTYSLKRIRLQRISNDLRFTSTGFPSSLNYDRHMLQTRKGAVLRKGMAYALLAVDRIFLARIFVERPILDYNVRSTMDDFFRGDIAQLESLLGMDLRGEWT